MSEEPDEDYVEDDVEGDQVDEPQPAADHEEPAAVEPTGHREVDEILNGLSRLEGLEVHEHVAEFENAHQALRRALDAGGQ